MQEHFLHLIGGKLMQSQLVIFLWSTTQIVSLFPDVKMSSAIWSRLQQMKLVSIHYGSSSDSIRFEVHPDEVLQVLIRVLI